jgi:pyridoxal phosphate enzyme (YggS family)
MSVEARVAEVFERIGAAARRAGRAADEITLIAASKSADPGKMRRAQAAGIRVFGENRVQEALAKAAEISGVTWHMIGHLQRNKARRAVELFEVIHSVDSVRLGEVLDRLGRERGRPVTALLEVNVGGERSKAGVAPAELEALAEALAGRSGLSIEGLMAIPPLADDDYAARRHFARLRELAESLNRLGLPGVAARELSMGMTADYEVAIEEGATLVRVGTAIFGERPSVP